jgi:hypothetical protein
MKSFVQFIIEKYTPSPVDLEIPHQDDRGKGGPWIPDKFGIPGTRYPLYRYDNEKTGVSTQLQYLPPEVFREYPQVDTGVHKKIADIQWLVGGSGWSRGTTDTAKTHQILNTVWGHLHDHIVRHSPDAVVYSTTDPVRNGIYQMMARRAGLPAFNLSRDPQDQRFMMSRQQRRLNRQLGSEM